VVRIATPATITPAQYQVERAMVSPPSSTPTNIAISGLTYA
jgi:hypothetical protein